MFGSLLATAAFRWPRGGRRAALLAAAIAVGSAGPLAADVPSEGGGAPRKLREVGVAKIDITPTAPVLLSGYASRKRELRGGARKEAWHPARAAHHLLDAHP